MGTAVPVSSRSMNSSACFQTKNRADSLEGEIRPSLVPLLVVPLSVLLFTLFNINDLSQKETQDSDKILSCTLDIAVSISSDSPLS